MTFGLTHFQHIVRETIDIGQSSYTAEPLVDRFKLVPVPKSGGTAKAMAAGILEAANSTWSTRPTSEDPPK